MKQFLLGILVGLLLGAVVLYTRTVHAQSSQMTIYVHPIRKPDGANQIEGSQVVGFSCTPYATGSLCVIATTK